jgi:GNAT superfamily N-acetyltransferase
LFVAPSSAERKRVVALYFDDAIAAAKRYGGEVRVANARDGACIVYPPGAYPRPWTSLLYTLRGAGRTSVASGLRGLRTMSMIRRHHPVTGPHYYVEILGVAPPLKGLGLGGSLLRDVLARADRASGGGVPVFLETSREHNVDYYRRFGFDVILEYTLPRGPRVWAMCRAPAR